MGKAQPGILLLMDCITSRWPLVASSKHKKHLWSNRNKISCVRWKGPFIKTNPWKTPAFLSLCWLFSQRHLSLHKTTSPTSARIHPAWLPNDFLPIHCREFFLADEQDLKVKKMCQFPAIVNWNPSLVNWHDVFPIKECTFIIKMNHEKVCHYFLIYFRDNDQ